MATATIQPTDKPYHEVYKIRILSIPNVTITGTDLYMGYSKDDFQTDHSKQKVYTSLKSANKVCDELIQQGYDVEVEAFELVNRRVKLSSVMNGL